MASTGLRERKKARTRRLIADSAARLFAQPPVRHTRRHLMIDPMCVHA